MTKKILIFESLSSISGGQKVLLNLIPYLTDSFEITVVIPGNGAFKNKLNEINTPTVFINPGSYSLGKKNIFQIIKYLIYSPLFIIKTLFLINKYDLLYVNSSRLLPMVVLANFFKKKPIIWHNHSLITDKKSNLLVELSANNKNVKKIICVSDFIKSKNKKIKEKTVIIYNGVNQNIFKKKDVSEVNNKKQICIIGDLIPTKGQDKLLYALSNINFKNWHLNIIGSSRTGNENYYNKLKKITYDLKLSNCVDFLGRKENVVDYLQNMDVLILPSVVSEACPMVVLEAMSCGIPVIASGLGGTSEIIKNDYTGYLFDIKKEEDLIKKLDQFFILSSEKIYEIKLNCRKEVELNYKLEDTANKIIKIIKSCIIYENSSNK